MGDELGLQDTLLRRADEQLMEGAEDVMMSLEVDQHQINETWKKALALAVHSSPLQQFGIGFGVGWFSGYLFKRVSRTAAFLVGCSFLALQGATALGLVKVNWRRLGVVVQERLSRVQSFSGDQQHSLSTKLVQFCHHHVYITSGFTTGAVTAITF